MVLEELISPRYACSLKSVSFPLKLSNSFLSEVLYALPSKSFKKDPTAITHLPKRMYLFITCSLPEMSVEVKRTVPESVFKFETRMIAWIMEKGEGRDEDLAIFHSNFMDLGIVMSALS